MCRIAGLVDFNKIFNSQQLEKLTLAIRDSMAHGGPDDAGIYMDKEKGVALGHRRLSIIDLSPLGHQPMGTEGGEVVITYNGEIYNFQEIKQDLLRKGYKFRSNTDTEVIIKAYQEWGENAFSKLLGMFAFCLYDQNRKVIYLVRDHAGIKPLYYHVSSEKYLLFASEVKTFKAFDKGWEVNRDWNIYFLIFGHIPEPFTTLKNVYMLPKGSFLKFDLQNNNYQIEEYTSFTFSNTINNHDNAVKDVREIFTKAVNRHLISNAPIGVFLSGGIDSSLIAIVASGFMGENLRTLSIIFNEKDYTEEKYQKIVHDKIKSKHSTKIVTQNDFINNLGDIFSAMDQPTVDGINTYFISQCAKEQGLKAVLSGIGGDELFGGYPSFSRIDKFWIFKSWKRKKLFRLFEYLDNDRLKRLSFLSIENPLAYYLLFRGFFSFNFVMDYLDADRTEIERALEKVYLNNKSEMGSKNFVSYLETDLYMKNQLLKDADFFSMWHSLEIRVPFLDKKLMDTVFSINESIKFHTGQPKYLITKAFEDILPKEIVSREKAGFSFPFQIWMRNNLYNLSNFIPNQNKKIAKKVLDKFGNGKLHWSRLWALVVMGVKNN
ncbi:MAG: asparagine synthase (glutamine-hydrolyzing) [Candidatus Brocadia sp.]|nr:asparagine synthase (glutamine-hydrolyzing) [Candidatus Brocadia sp.]